MDKIVVLLKDAVDECDCDWWCWLTAIALGIFLGAIAVALILSIGAINPVVAASLILPILGGLLLADYYTVAPQLTCDNVGKIERQASTTLKGLRQAIQETQAELNFQLSARDILIANIIAFTSELSELNESNQHRLLDATTLTNIQAQYNMIRQSLLTRAHTLSKLAEDAFNFERDSKVNLVKHHSYHDEERKGYTAAESLLRDLDGLDYIGITGRAQDKTMQLSHVVSLRKNYPMSFPSILFTGRCRFMATMKDFDYWFPGTYMQRIKEVRVEVVVEDGTRVVPARGYISNDGVSHIRFMDSADRFHMDNQDVFVEPDNDVAKLCFKRFERRRHIDTMAFPDFDSYLHKDRMLKVQDRERNFFENIGPESTWVIELLPDQSLNFSQIADVRVHFQYEALYDENLKWVLQQKRYTERRESAYFSFKKIAEAENRIPDFSGTVEIDVLKSMFEAPLIEKKILNVGFALKPKGGIPFNGVAKLEVSFQLSAPPVKVETNNDGIVATASEHNAGSGLADLEALTQNKNVDGKWTVRVVDFPPGVNADGIEDVLLLLNYEYSSKV